MSTAVAPLLAENCPTCGSPGRLNLKHDNKQVLDILRAEQPLLEYDHDWVHQNIATLDGHLLSLRQSLSRLESLTALIQTQIDTISAEKHRFESISAPIRRLPRDILLEIFSLTSRQADAGYYPWTLGHICHWWRDIIHSSPTLWSAVVLYPPSRYHPEIIETQLQRSGNVPLSVYIHTQHYGGAHNLTILDRVMSLCHRWATLELHAHGPMHARKLPSFLPQLRTLKVRGPWSRDMLPVLDAPLLKTVRSEDLSLQSIPNHITHLALSNLFIEELPILLSFPNLLELHFKAKNVTREIAPSSMITHPTIRYLSVSGTRILPFLALPALTHLRYSLDRTEDSSPVSAFLLRSRCTLKTLLTHTMRHIDSFLQLLESQPSICRLSVSLLGDHRNMICQKLSSPEFLPNLEHLTMTWISKEFWIAAKMIRARWYAPMRRIRTFALVRNALEEKNVNMDVMQVLKDEGLDFRVVEGQYEVDAWLDPLKMESEDVL